MKPTQQFLLTLIGSGILVLLLLHGGVEITEVVPLVLLQEVIRLGIQDKLFLTTARDELHAVIPDRHELMHHTGVEPLHQQRSHGIALTIHDDQLAVTAVIEQSAALIFSLDLMKHFASDTTSSFGRGLVTDVRSLFHSKASSKDTLAITHSRNAYVGGSVEHLILTHLPLTGRTAELHTIDQIQSVVVRIDRNVISKELVDFLNTAGFISIGQFLNLIRTANISEVYISTLNRYNTNMIFTILGFS